MWSGCVWSGYGGSWWVMCVEWVCEVMVSDGG